MQQPSPQPSPRRAATRRAELWDAPLHMPRRRPPGWFLSRVVAPLYHKVAHLSRTDGPPHRRAAAEMQPRCSRGGVAGDARLFAARSAPRRSGRASVASRSATRARRTTTTSTSSSGGGSACSTRTSRPRRSWATCLPPARTRSCRAPRSPAPSPRPRCGRDAAEMGRDTAETSPSLPTSVSEVLS